MIKEISKYSTSGLCSSMSPKAPALEVGFVIGLKSSISQENNDYSNHRLSFRLFQRANLPVEPQNMEGRKGNTP
jgi:hypothetical protein